MMVSELYPVGDTPWVHSGEARGDTSTRQYGGSAFNASRMVPPRASQGMGVVVWVVLVAGLVEDRVKTPPYTTLEQDRYCCALVPQ